MPLSSPLSQAFHESTSDKAYPAYLPIFEAAKVIEGQFELQ
jgi:hypothetical protein